MIFELTVLGSSSALPTSTKFPSAHVLNAHERFFLIDCGEGTQIQLRKSKIGFNKINNIFISHMHGDHVFGLFGVLSTYQLLNRQTPLNLYGPPDLEKMLNFFLKNFATDLPYEIKLKTLPKREKQLVFEDKLMEVYAFPLKHRIQTFGYLFKEKPRLLNIRKNTLADYKPGVKQIQAIKRGEDLVLQNGKCIPNAKLTEPPHNLRSYAYCSDTSFYEKNIDFVKNVDLLYHEATFKHKDKKLAKQTGHSTAAQAAEFALKANAGRLLIGHFSSRYKNSEELLEEAKTIFPSTEIATELAQFKVDLTRAK